MSVKLLGRSCESTRKRQGMPADRNQKSGRSNCGALQLHCCCRSVQDLALYSVCASDEIFKVTDRTSQRIP